MNDKIKEECEQLRESLIDTFGFYDESIDRMVRKQMESKYGADGLRNVMKPAQSELIEVKKDVEDDSPRKVYSTIEVDDTNSMYNNNYHIENEKSNSFIEKSIVKGQKKVINVIPKVSSKTIKDNWLLYCYNQLIEIIVIIDDDLYVCDDRLNYYKKIDNNNETKFITYYLLTLNQGMANLYTSKFVNELIKRIRENTPSKCIGWDDINLPKSEINYINKPIVQTIQMNRSIFTYCINARKIEKKFFRNDFFDEYCRESFYDANKMKEFLLEVIGYLISEFREDKAILLIGDRTRTSVMTNILELLLGKEEVSYKSASEFKEFRKNKDLNRKKINFAELTSIASKDIEIFNTILESKQVQIENKNRKITDITPRVKFVFYCKQLPDKLKSNEILMENFIVVNFNKSFDIRKDIFDDIKNNGELDTIFTMSKEKLEILKENRFEFSVNEDYKKIFNNSSHILEFINEFCDTGKEYKIYKSDLVEAYEKYCKENYIAERYSDHKFIEFIAGLDSIEEKKIRAVKGGRPKASFTGIKLKEFPN